MKHFIIYIKGILLGFISLAIPGLSASTVALSLDIYYDLINSIANIFKKFKKSIIFLFFILLGFMTGSYLGALSVSTIYQLFPLAIILLILGFVFGGYPKMIIDIKNNIHKPSCLISLIVTFALLIVYGYIVTEGEEITLEYMEVSDYVALFIVGFITSSTLVIPGVDFAVVLLSLGYYYAICDAMANIYTLHNLMIMVVYIIGYALGSFAFSKLIKYLVKRFPSQTSFVSYAFMISAPFIVVNKCIVNNDSFVYSLPQLIVGIILFIIAFLLIYLVPKLIFLKKHKE